MKVKDMIEYLSSFPDDTPVLINNGGDITSFMEVTWVYEDEQGNPVLDVY